MSTVAIDVISLTGLTTGVIGALLYKAGHHAFISGGSFQSKPAAIFIILFESLLLYSITPYIREFWSEFLPLFNPFNTTGLILCIGTLLVNNMVTHWRHDTKSSLTLYGVGLILIILGFNL